MKKSVWARILRYIKPYRALTAAGCVSAALYVLGSLLGPVFIGRAIDSVAGKGNVDFPRVLFWLIMLLAAIAVAALCQWLMNVCVRKVSALAARDIRNAAFDTLLEVPLARIDTQRHGDIISCLVNDTDLVCDGILHGLTQLLPGVATILGTLAVMLVLNPLVTLAVVLVTPLSILFAGFVGKRTAHMFRKQSEAQGKLSGHINEMVAGQSVVKAFGYEKECFARFDEIADELYDSGFKSVFYSSVVNPGTRFVNAIVYAAVASFGALSAVAGSITVGQLSCFLTYANQYTKPFNEITGVLTQLQSAQAGAERLLKIIDWPRQTSDAGLPAPAECKGEVSLQDISFRYVPERPLIENFSLSVKAGSRVAVVGPTGCGKTTLINLLMRFYDVNSGVIAVDGRDITQMQRNALRDMYGMVLQDTWLKCATIRENIAYANPEATDEEVIAAAKAAYAHSFIKRFPKGYQTMLTPGGGNLSAGQRQLLCIARIMLSKPQMLILDEATSSIDTRTEMLIQRAFEKLMQGRTSFVVAHRLSTIRNADVILAMRDGRVVEQGSHDELLAAGGFYAQLYNSQFAPME